MKKLISFSFLTVFFVVCCSPVFAQTSRKSAIKQIDLHCKKVETFTRKYKSPQLIFADTSDYTENSKPKWKKFASEKVLEKFREEKETYSIAYNWRKNDKIIRSNFTLFSPSGDWAKYVYLYFREDGTLAKAESELKTFYGNFIVLNDIYFNAKGEILKKTTKYLDLKTEKPRKPSEDDFANTGDNFKSVEFYKKTDKLPFAFLLKRQKN